MMVAKRSFARARGPHTPQPASTRQRAAKSSQPLPGEREWESSASAYPHGLLLATPYSEDAERLQHRSLVVIGALADDLVATGREFEASRHADAESLSRGFDCAQSKLERPQMRAGQPEFDQNRIGCGIGSDCDDFVCLIGKRLARRGKVGAHRCLAIEDRAGAEQLVAWMFEGCENAVPI